MIVRPCSHVAWRRIDDETFVINLDQKVMYGLNATGGDVWSQLEEGCDLKAIVACVAGTFDKEDVPHDLEFSVYKFLNQLKKYALISFDDELDIKTSPSEHETLPQITWQEDLVSIGYSCAQKPGQTPACTQVPSN